MSKSKSIGIAVVLALLIGIVSLTVLRNASSSGVIVREPARHGVNSPAGATANNSDLTLPPSPDRVAGPIARTSTEARAFGGSAAPGTATDMHSALPDGSENMLPNPGGSVGKIEVKTEVVVHVVGAVKRPGVYHLRSDARNDDAVKAAGGLSADANGASVNLAAHAVDGAQLYVKTLKQQPTGGADSDMSGMPTPSPTHGAPGKLPANVAKHGAAGGGTGAKPAKLKSPSEGKINLNTASAEDLQRISGIGPSMAEKILAYRQENHGFQSVDDLMQISGIGEKKFAKMRPFVKVR